MHGWLEKKRREGEKQGGEGKEGGKGRRERKKGKGVRAHKRMKVLQGGFRSGSVRGGRGGGRSVCDGAEAGLFLVGKAVFVAVVIDIVSDGERLLVLGVSMDRL